MDSITVLRSPIEAHVKRSYFETRSQRDHVCFFVKYIMSINMFFCRTTLLPSGGYYSGGQKSFSFPYLLNLPLLTVYRRPEFQPLNLGKQIQTIPKPYHNKNRKKNFD